MMKMMFNLGLANVLVVENERPLANTLVTGLLGAGYRAVAAYDAEGAIHTARHFQPHLLVCKAFMPGMNGIDVATSVVEASPECKVLLYTGQVNSELMARMLIRARRRGYQLHRLAEILDSNEFLHTVSRLIPREKELLAA